MDQTTQVWSFSAIGTSWHISLYENVALEQLFLLKKAVWERIEAFDRIYSRFRAESLVSKISQKIGAFAFPKDAAQLFSFYRKLYDVSDGKVTPLIGQTLAEAGYDAKYSLKPKQLVSPAGWDDVMVWDGETLTTTSPVLLDFGAAGKGYLVDIISSLLRDSGITRFCVNAGGDMVINGLQIGLDIGLENPTNVEEVIGIIPITTGALCGSAGNRRAWSGYNHILDPMLLRSPDHILASWCLAADAMTADGLATAMYFTPIARLLNNFSFEYCMVFPDGTAEYSNEFKGTLFTSPEGART